MKTLILSAVLGLCFAGAATAQTAPTPANTPSSSVQAPTKSADLLDTLSERIGDGRAYRLTRKGGETIVCTLQGRTDYALVQSAIVEYQAGMRSILRSTIIFSKSAR